MTLRIIRRGRKLRLLDISARLLCGVAFAVPLASPSQAEDGVVRILTFNTWREYFQSSIGASPSDMSDFLTKGNYDIIAMQELCYISDCAYVRDLPGVLEKAGLGSYTGTRSGEDGVLSRFKGTGGEFRWGDYFSGQVSSFTTDAQSGIPKTSFVSAHFDWRDEPETYRTYEATTLNAWAKGQANPILMMGDFNAGDVSERGLHTAEQQSYLFARTIVDGASTALWNQLAKEYTPDGREAEYEAYAASMKAVDANGVAQYRNVIQAYFDTHRNEYPGVTSISQMSWRQWEEIVAKDMAAKGLTFEDETYPVASNQPRTLNILKRQFMVLNSASTREGYAPHGRPDDGSSSWPNAAKDNTATSWDYSAIDHFMASRPFGKWWQVVDDPKDAYLGGLHDVSYANDGKTPLSDHELVAHEVRWIGPVLADYAGDATKKTVIWGADANTFAEAGGVFHLTRNNMRTDMSLGQLADEQGNPLYAAPNASHLSDGQIGALLAQSVYDLADPTGARAQLLKYINPSQLEAYNTYVAKLSDKNSGAYYRDVIQDYFDSHRSEFPGISTISAMSWEQWGGILLKYVGRDVTFSNDDVSMAGSLEELKKALGLADPAVRARLAAQYGLDFDNDPNAVLKIPLDCGNAGMLGLKGARDYCIDDHSFIGETLVKDGGTVIVDEDAALGTSAASLHLDNGTLRIAGTEMSMLDREVVLEAGGGAIDVADAANAVAIGRTISGEGSLTKLGAGALGLFGTNTYTGATAVRQGLLVVDGSIAASSLTTVFDGATLAGIGTTGNLTIASGGTVAPGHSIGTLNVAGNLTFERGSVYQVEANAEGASDRIDVTGKTEIQGGTVMSLAANGTYRPQTDYTILNSAGGVYGAFGAVTSNFAFLDPTLTYGATDVVLTLERNDTAFDQVGDTFNQRAAARGAESLGFGNSLYDAIVLQDQATARSAFAQIGGEVHASTYGVLVDNSRFVRDAVGERLRGAAGEAAGQGMSVMSYDAGGPKPDAPDTDRFAVWGMGFGSWADIDGDGNASGLSSNVGGLVAGADANVGDNWRLGVLAGYSQTSVDLDDLAASSESDSFHLGLYAGTRNGPLALRLGAAYAWNSIDTTRQVAIPSFDETLTAGYDASTTQVFGEVGYRVAMANVALEPFLGLAYVNFSSDGFSEDGGVTGLDGEGDDLETLFTTLGLRASTSFNLGGTVASLHGTLGWQHASGDIVPEATLAFTGGDDFAIRGAPIAEDVAIVKAGLDFAATPNATLGIVYSGQFGSGMGDNGVTGQLSIKF